MKVLFAIGNPTTSKNVADKYFEKYGDRLEYKDVFFFKALIEEVKRDNSYDRIVISEELEQFSSSNIEAIDKFLFTKIDNLTDEIQDSDIIFICSDRREKGDPFLERLFSIGIYNMLVGDDRNFEPLCESIRKPNNKREAKAYLNINSIGISTGATIGEDEVDEVQMMNILKHYEKLGDNSAQYVNSFDRIAEQYSRGQLKIIVTYLPTKVKNEIRKEEKYAYLFASTPVQNRAPIETVAPVDKTYKAEKKSLFGIIKQRKNETKGNDSNREEELKRQEELKKQEAARQAELEKIRKEKEEIERKKKEEQARLEQMRIEEQKKQEELKQQEIRRQEELKRKREEEEKKRQQLLNSQINTNDVIVVETPEKKNQAESNTVDSSLIVEVPVVRVQNDEKPKATTNEQKKPEDLAFVEEQKRLEQLARAQQNSVKQGEKQNIQVENKVSSEDAAKKQQEEQARLLELAKKQQEEKAKLEQQNIIEEQKKAEEARLAAEEKKKAEEAKRAAEEQRRAEEAKRREEEQARLEELARREEALKIEAQRAKEEAQRQVAYSQMPSDYRKAIVMVGANKAGTTFVVNAVSSMLAEKGLETAVLDMTKERGLYYIYSNEDYKLTQIALECMNNLAEGRDIPITPKKNLNIYTTVPGSAGENRKSYRHKAMLDTLKQKNTLTIIDADFTTPLEYFEQASEIYLVQDLDILKVQETTLFLRELKNRKVDMNKVRIIINKYVKTTFTPKEIIESLSYYNDPSRTFVDDLLGTKVMYSIIPFDIINYGEYVNALRKGKIDYKNYTEEFKKAIDEICMQIYPVAGNSSKKKRGLFG